METISYWQAESQACALAVNMPLLAGEGRVSRHDTSIEYFIEKKNRGLNYERETIQLR
jgi:hypothetical protein